MPDNLTKQDVYVPVRGNSEMGVGIYSERVGEWQITQLVEPCEGVYVLTGKELADLLTEYEESLHGNSTSFLKEKGVEI
jgi:hypothetical protein